MPYGSYVPWWRCSDASLPEERGEDLEDEKRALERRLKEVEARLAEARR